MAAGLGESCEVPCGSDATERLFAARGWSMRHGRRKRLAASSQVVGVAPHAGVCRGRSVFKRSVNRGSRMQACWHDHQAGHHARLACKDECMGLSVGQLQALSASELLADWQQDCFEYEYAEVDACWWQDVDDEKEDDEGYSEQAVDDQCSTCASTVASVEELGLAARPKMVAEHVQEGGVGSCPFATLDDADGGSVHEETFMLGMPDEHFSAWDLAVFRAERNAKLYRQLREPTQQGPEKFVGEREHKKLLKSLQLEFNVFSSYPKPGRSPFEQLRWNFFKEHSRSFCNGLRVCLGGEVSLRPVPLNSEVGEKFWSACNGGRSGTLVPALHGTHENNLANIYGVGLVVPGKGNVVKVANGAAYGVGIYTASMSSPGMSRSYARGHNPPVLVCGVLDSFNEEEVKHPTSGALVIFDDHRVAPLFVATQSSPTSTLRPGRSGRVPLPRARRIAAPHPPTPLRRGPIKQEKKQLSEPPAAVQLVGVVGYLSRRAARRRFGPSDLRSTIAAHLAR